MAEKKKNTWIWIAAIGGVGIYLYYYYNQTGSFPWQSAAAALPTGTTPITTATTTTLQTGGAISPVITTPPVTLTETPINTAQASQTGGAISLLGAKTLTPGQQLFCTPQPTIPAGAVVMTEAEFEAGVGNYGSALWNNGGRPVYVTGRGVVTPGNFPPIIQNMCAAPATVQGIHSRPGRLGLIANCI